ncbi:MAG TPA: hypothetical protein VM598_03950, partial [Bdellovibrionota bacterium]|nr:hypothetical protein [Bdellovibrionota bacterium]
AAAALRQALTAARTPVGAGEANLVKKIAGGFFFPDHPESISVRFEVAPGNFKYTDEYLSAILLAFMVDPRATRYDPEVLALVTGKLLDGRPAPFQIVWVLGKSRMELAPAEGSGNRPIRIDLNASRDLAQWLPPQDSPLRYKLEIVNEVLFVTPEVVGFRFFPFARTVQMSLKGVSRNRIFETMAAALGKASVALRSNDWLVKPLQLAADTAATHSERAEEFVRKYLFGAAAMRKTPESVIAKLGRVAEQRTKNINAKLAVTLKQLGARSASAAEIAAAQTAAQAEIAAAQTQAATRSAAVNAAVGELKASKAFTAMSATQQEAALLKTAERAGKTRVFTPERGVKWVTGLMTAYYLYRAVAQLQRTDDPREREILKSIYFWKTLMTVVYVVPYAGEAAFALDMMDATAPSKYRPPGMPKFDAETLLRSVWDAVEGLAVQSSGLSRGEVWLTEIGAKLQLPLFSKIPKNAQLQFPEDYRWGEKGLLDYARSAGSGTPEQQECRAAKFRDHVRQLMQGHAALIFFMKEREMFRGLGPMRELTEFEMDLFTEITKDGNSSYFHWVEELLSPMGE